MAGFIFDFLFFSLKKSLDVCRFHDDVILDEYVIIIDDRRWSCTDRSHHESRGAGSAQVSLQCPDAVLEACVEGDADAEFLEVTVEENIWIVWKI